MNTSIEIPKDSKVYLNKPYVQVFWNPLNKILTSRWTGFCTYDEIKAVAQRIIDAVLFEGARKVLYDAREIEVLDENSQKYIAGNFTKEMIKVGIEYSATVLPVDIFAKFSVDDIQSSIKIPEASHNRFFQNIDDASEWLKSKSA
ncbi:hypothetical protein N7E81_11785 [Reichenbachiella carrageenanivorans]|uniref:SpoIIAA-like n=1 Tax=Reichenbachiella carrageenanivorans TaxID=2979869 RepID=A0ABY6CWF2_9BACT|nr:hypothetical protein [Reichenbachiella carrageenanivorans]UXX78039.1 hypothetical protein N7E81_11785 [Reichenbachiella carrageenanivorans]